MKIVSDHGWPVASDGSDENALEAFKNERDYIAQGGNFKTTVAAMDWALREIGRLRTPLAVSPAPAPVSADPRFPTNVSGGPGDPSNTVPGEPAPAEPFCNAGYVRETKNPCAVCGANPHESCRVTVNAGEAYGSSTLAADLKPRASASRRGEPAPAGEWQKRLQELCGDEINGGFIRDLCFTVWNICCYPKHSDGHSDWSNDTLPTVQAGIKRVRAMLVASPSPPADEWRETMANLLESYLATFGVKDDLAFKAEALLAASPSPPQKNSENRDDGA